MSKERPNKKDFDNITNKYQKKIDNNVVTIKKKTYSEMIFNEIKNYLKELNDKQLMQFLYNYEFKDIIKKYENNIIIETLSYLISSKHLRLKPMTRFNINLKYPLLIQCLLIRNDFKTVLKIVEELLILFEIVPNTDEELFKYSYQSLLKLKKYCLQFEEICNNNTVINIYNSFNGIEFTQISIKKKELFELNQNMLIINVGYNITEPVENYIYLRDKHYDGLFLTEDSLKKFKTNLKIMINPMPKRYSILERIKPSNNAQQKNNLFAIVLNYNDIYYTSTEAIFTRKDIDLFNNGSLLFGYNELTYLMYVSELFYRYSNKPNKINSIEETHKHLGILLKQLYDKNATQTINNWNEYVKTDMKIFDDDTDKECFKIYITKLENYTDINNELEIHKYIQYITNYFIPDVDN